MFDLYADTSIAALWTWELASPALYLESAHLKKVLSLRQSLSQQGQLIQSLAKLLKTIGKAKAASDLAKITTRHATYVKAIQKRNEATSKLREKQLKEKLRLQEEEEKKRRADNEKRMKEIERLNKEQERVRLKQERELVLLREKEKKDQERKGKEEAKERERREKEEAKEREK